MSININELKEEVREMGELISKSPRQALDEAFKELFNKYPELVGFTWNQYTPSFKDGDLCEFTLSSPDDIYYTKEFADKITLGDGVGVYTLKDLGEEGDEEDNVVLSESGLSSEQVRVVGFYSKYTGDFNAADKEIDSLFSRDLEDIFEAAYGDGVAVTVTRNGVHVEDYDCGY